MDIARLRVDSTFLAAACFLEQVDIIVSAGLVEPYETRLLTLYKQPTRKSERVFLLLEKGGYFLLQWAVIGENYIAKVFRLKKRWHVPGFLLLLYVCSGCVHVQ